MFNVNAIRQLLLKLAQFFTGFLHLNCWVLLSKIITLNFPGTY